MYLKSLICFVRVDNWVESHWVSTPVTDITNVKSFCNLITILITKHMHSLGPKELRQYLDVFLKKKKNNKSQVYQSSRQG